MTDQLAKHGFECIGVDTSAGNVWASVTHLPFRDGAFECVILIEVVEHISPMAYGEILRTCKHKILLTTPHPWSEPLTNALLAARLIEPRRTPHLNLVKVAALPLGRLARKGSVLFLDQWAVFDVS